MLIWQCLSSANPPKPVGEDVVMGGGETTSSETVTGTMREVVLLAPAQLATVRKIFVKNMACPDVAKLYVTFFRKKKSVVSASIS